MTLRNLALIAALATAGTPSLAASSEIAYLALTDERAARLSSRELDCLSLAAVGKTLEETAMILSLSTSTVRFHLRNASRKLGAANRMQAISKAAYLGLLGPIF